MTDVPLEQMPGQLDLLGDLEPPRQPHPPDRSSHTMTDQQPITDEQFRAVFTVLGEVGDERLRQESETPACTSTAASSSPPTNPPDLVPTSSPPRPKTARPTSSLVPRLKGTRTKTGPPRPATSSRPSPGRAHDTTPEQRHPRHPKTTPTPHTRPSRKVTP